MVFTLVNKSLSNFLAANFRFDHHDAVHLVSALLLAQLLRGRGRRVENCATQASQSSTQRWRVFVVHRNAGLKIEKHFN